MSKADPSFSLHFGNWFQLLAVWSSDALFCFTETSTVPSGFSLQVQLDAAVIPAR